MQGDQDVSLSVVRFGSVDLESGSERDSGPEPCGAWEAWTGVEEVSSSLEDPTALESDPLMAPSGGAAAWLAAGLQGGAGAESADRPLGAAEWLALGVAVLAEQVETRADVAQWLVQGFELLGEDQSHVFRLAEEGHGGTRGAVAESARGPPALRAGLEAESHGVMQPGTPEMAERTRGASGSGAASAYGPPAPCAGPAGEASAFGRLPPQGFMTSSLAAISRGGAPAPFCPT
eukprot:2260550-Alexandrium_andersonii.AAC.1